MHELAFVLAGLVVGLAVGLTGVGGGSLMTPILIFFFGLKPHFAVGTDLLFAAGTKLTGTLRLVNQRLVDWRIVGSLSAGSIPAALATLYVLHLSGPADAGVQRFITSTLGVALLLTALATLYKALRSKGRGLDAGHSGPGLALRPRHWSLPVLLGAVVGTLVTLTSVGAGAIGVSVLMIIYPALPLPRVIAADIAYAVPLTLVAGLGHASLGSVDWHLLVLLLSGSIPGIWIGSYLTQHVNERAVRSALSLLLGWVSFKLIAL